MSVIEKFNHFFDHNLYASNGDPISSLVSMVKFLCEQMDEKQSEINQLQTILEEYATKEELREAEKHTDDLKHQVDNQFLAYNAGIKNELIQLSANHQQFRHNIESRVDGILCNMDNRFKLQSDRLKETIDACSQDVSKIKGDLQSETKERVRLKQDIIDIRRIIPKPTEALLNSTIGRLEKLDFYVQQNSEDSAKKFKDLSNQQNEIRMTIDGVHEELNDTLLKVQAKYESMPTTFSHPDDQPKILDGNVIDIAPLIRGFYRDSKRLDNFNETISKIRLENDGLVNSILSIQENQQIFNHSIHDIGLDLQKQRAQMIERFQHIHSLNSLFDSQIAEIWAFLAVYLDSHIHVIANFSKITEQIESIFTKISTKALPALSDLGELQLEATSLRENVSEKINTYDNNREEIKKFTIPDIETVTVQHVKIDPYKRTLASPFENSKIKNKNNPFEGGLIQSSIEEIRVKQNELQHRMEDFISRVNDSHKKIEETVQEKMDSNIAERYFLSLEGTVSKLEKKNEKNDRFERSAKIIVEKNDKTEVSSQAQRPIPMKKLPMGILKNQKNSRIQTSSRSLNINILQNGRPDDNNNSNSNRVAGLSSRAAAISRLVSSQKQNTLFD